MSVPRHTTLRRPALVLAAILAAAAAPGAEVGVTDGPKGVVVNTRNGKAYAAFPDLGVVKILKGGAGREMTSSMRSAYARLDVISYIR